MIPTTQQRAVLGLIVFNAVLVSIVVHLMFFAAQGRRFTGEDGDIDRAASIARDTRERTERTEADSLEREERTQADRDIIARIDNLHQHTWPAP